MMKIQVLLNLGTGQGLPPFLEDEVHDVDDALGNLLIAKGFARQVDAAHPATKAAEAKPGEVVPGHLPEPDDAFNKLRRQNK